MLGESKSGLASRVSGMRALIVSTSLLSEHAHQHMKSQLPSMPTRAQVLMFPMIP